MSQGGVKFVGSTDPLGKPWADLYLAVNEALLNAIDAARQGLTSTMVDWSLVDVSCRSGGGLDNHVATVTILASVPDSSTSGPPGS